MRLGARLREGLGHRATRRSRRILVATVVTLVTSAVLLGLISVMRWRSQQALQSDTHTVLTQGGQQLLRALHSRRGTLTFIRDTLNRRPNLTLPQLKAMGASAVEHTRHLIGAGQIRAGEGPVWWSGPHALSKSEQSQLNRAILQRAKLPGAWRVPSTLVAPASDERPILIMLEPLRASIYGQSAVVGAFDLTPLLEDFAASTLPHRAPVQILDGETPLLRSANWQVPTEELRPIIVEYSVAIDAARWTIQMQPGSTRVVQTLSWLTILLIGLSVLAGLGVTIIVWILTARAWILQRVVAKRTAVLRRVSHRLRQMAITDELTGLHNRRFFLNRWEWECERAKRYRRPLACLMIDVNGFKQVNDHLGHHVGDLVLQRVAQELQAVLRQSDILARLGGDEFIIALPETSPEQVAAVAEKLRQLTIEVPANGRTRGVPSVSLSVGMGRVKPDDKSAQDVLEAADQSLYAHKRSRLQAPASTPPKNT